MLQFTKRLTIFIRSFMRKLQLTGQNLSRVFNSRSVHMHSLQLICFETKLLNLQLKTWPKRLRKDYLSVWDQFYKWLLFKNVKNITTIYKPISIKHKHFYKHQSYYKHIYTDTKVILNAKLIKDWIILKLFIVMGLMKWRTLFTGIFQDSSFSALTVVWQ